MFPLLLAVLIPLGTVAQLPPSSAQEFTITTIAGTPPRAPGGDGGPAVEANLSSPAGVAVDGAGNVYIADWGNRRIRRVDPSGIITTIAGTGESGSSGDGGPAVEAKLSSPAGVAVDGAGNVYISDAGDYRIRRVDPSGIITTIAGTGVRGFIGDGGPAVEAKLDGPRGIAVDGAGNVYIADSGSNRIRRVDPSGIITTIAGTGESGSSGDGGPAVEAKLDGPRGIAVDGAGNVYIADYYNYRIRRVDPSGTITAFAGTGRLGFSGDGGPAVEAKLGELRGGVAVDEAGNVYVAHWGNHRIRRVDASGTITTFAVETGIEGIAVDGAGNAYISRPGAHQIRRVDASGIITTIAGTGESGEGEPIYQPGGFSGDGVPAVEAQLNGPSGVAVDGAGNVYIADYGNHRVRRVDASGTITTFAGTGEGGFSGDGGPAVEAQLHSPFGVAVDGAGNVYISQLGHTRIRRVDASGTITTFAGTGEQGFSGDGGPATQARLVSPFGLAVDGAGNVYIADRGDHRIRRVDASGTITTFAGTGEKGIVGYGIPAVQTQLRFPSGVAVDGDGNVYIADSGNHRIRRVDASGIITTVAGTGFVLVEGDIGWGGSFNGDGGPAVQARMRVPTGVAVDGAGNVYIADSRNHRIRRVDASGIITTIAGTGSTGLYEGSFGGDGGPAVEARLSVPITVAVDRASNVYIADSGNHLIRKLARVSGGARPHPTDTQPFVIPESGGVSFSSLGTSTSTLVGYGRVEEPDGRRTMLAGLAIFGSRQNGILVSEAAVPASVAVQEGRIFAETAGAVRTGLAIANPNDAAAATIEFFFTDSIGIDSGHGRFTLGPRQQMARFLDEAPFNAGSGIEGAFTFTSDLPVAVIALRGFVNERSEFLMTTLPVTPVTADTRGTVYFPHFADGGGWTTQVILVNPTHAPIGGRVRFFGPGREMEAAVPVAVTLDDGRRGSTFSYSIPPRSATRLQTANSAGSMQIGSVRAVPDPRQPAPAGVSIFSFQKDGITVSESGVPASTRDDVFRVYVEASGPPGQPHSVRSGIAVTNTSGVPARVSLELTNLDGTATGPTEWLTIPPSGHVARFIDEFFPALTTPFSGILRIASTIPDIIAAIGLRLVINQRYDVLVTTTPPVEENRVFTGNLFFPHFVDSGGWTTQFILFNASMFPEFRGQTSSGLIRFIGQDGQQLMLSLAPTAAPAIP